jgi:hypothetical protein
MSGEGEVETLDDGKKIPDNTRHALHSGQTRPSYTQSIQGNENGLCFQPSPERQGSSQCRRRL